MNVVGSNLRTYLSSLRKNMSLILFLLLMALSIVVYVWIFTRMLESQQAAMNQHYMQTVAAIREQETFLQRFVEQKEWATIMDDAGSAISVRRKVFERDALAVYEGQESSFVIPFTIALNNAGQAVSNKKSYLFQFGVHTVHFYSSYWAVAHYQAPQMFLFDSSDGTALAVPAITGSHREKGGAFNLLEQARSLIQEHLAEQDSEHIHWVELGRGNGISQKWNLVGFTETHLSALPGWPGDSEQQVVVSVLVDLEHFRRVLVTSPMFDEFSLRTPTGELLGGAGHYSLEDKAVSLTRNGIIVKAEHDNAGGWVAYYRVSYWSLIWQARWQLLTVFVAAQVLLLAFWALLTYYNRYVRKAQHIVRRQFSGIEDFNHILMEAGYSAVVVMRSSDGRVLYENTLASQWLEDNLDTRLWYVALMAEKLDTGEACVQLGNRYLQIRFCPVSFENTDARLCIYADITEQKRLYLSPQEHQQRMDEAEQIKAMFLSTVNHEVRTPLHGLLGTLELLERTRLTTRQRQYLQRLRGASAGILRLVTNALDVAKIETDQMSLEIKEFCPLDISEELLREYSVSAEHKGLQIFACIDPGIPGAVMGDPVRIKQILANLLSNAIKFTDLGHIALRLRLIHLEQGMATLQWQVTDTGIGIPAEDQQHLFEPFYQGYGRNGVHSGAGLGLSVCQRLARLMEGTLQVVSDVGLGSSFTLEVACKVVSESIPHVENVELSDQVVYVDSPVRELTDCMLGWLKRLGGKAAPLDSADDVFSPNAVLLELMPSHDLVVWAGRRVFAIRSGQSLSRHSSKGWQASLYDIREIIATVAMAQQGVMQRVSQSKPIQELGRLGLKVLVAEDNPINQLIFAEQLEELGCQVTLATNGQEALQRWVDNKFDVVMTDINMPHMDGYQLAEVLRERQVSIPIIGVTANALREEHERCRAAGMTAWIVKPLTLQTLHDVLEDACGVVPRKEAPDTAVSYPVADAEAWSIPEKMRELFLDTMTDDIATAHQALSVQDIRKLIATLHRMRGAFTVVGAVYFADSCGDFEELLEQNDLDAELAEDVKRLLEQITETLVSK